MIPVFVLLVFFSFCIRGEAKSEGAFGIGQAGLGHWTLDDNGVLELYTGTIVQRGNDEK